MIILFDCLGEGSPKKSCCQWFVSGISTTLAEVIIRVKWLWLDSEYLSYYDKSSLPKISFKTCQVLNLILCFQLEYPMYWTYGEWTEGFRWLVGYLKLDDVGVYISERTKRIQKGDCKITPFANKILCFGNDYH